DVGPWLPVMVTDLHLEGSCSRCDLLADGAKTVDSEFPACQSTCKLQILRQPIVPLALTDKAVRIQQLASYRQQKRHCEVSHASRIAGAAMGDGYASFYGGFVIYAGKITSPTVDQSKIRKLIHQLRSSLYR